MTLDHAEAPEPTRDGSLYLTGNYAPIGNEDHFQDVPVSGIIPEGLHGTYYRVGPNPQFAPLKFYAHCAARHGCI